MRQQRKKTRALHYLAALLAPLVVSGLVQLTWPFFEQSPVPPFLLAVTFCAWYGGVGPGLLSVLISLLLADYFFVPPYFALWPPKRADFVYLVTLTAVGALISTVTELMHRARRRAEFSRDSTKQSEDMYRALLQATSQAMWTTDLEGHMHSGATGWGAITGQSAEQMSGSGWLEALHPEDRRQLAEMWSAALHEKTSYVTEARIRQSGGSYLSYLVRGVPIRAEDGSVSGWIKSASDITQHKLVEERFRLVVEASPSAVLTVDEGGCITLVNTQTEQLFGYMRDEMLGRPVEMLVPRRFRGAHPGHRNSFFASPSARAMGAGRDLFGLHKDGSEVPIEIGLSPFKTSEGSFVLASIIDITERKRAESRFRQVFEHAPNGMVMVDRDGQIAMVNAQIEKSFGYQRDELMGQSIETLVPQRFHANHAAYRNGFIAQPSMRSMGAGRDLYGLRKDRTEFPVEIGLTPMDSEQGLMVLGTIVDITERKQSEQKLRRSQQQLAGIIGSAMDAIITVDQDQRIVLFNAAAERAFLFPAEDAIGQTLDRFIPERFRAGHKQHVEGFGETHVTRRSMGALGALYGLRADGEEFPIEASISQIESEGQKVYTVILRDITERKHAEEALKEQARMLDLAPVLIRDLKGRILFWNTGTEQMYGWKSAEALGELTHKLLKTEFPRPLEEIQARLLARGHWEGELVKARKDGTRIVVASHWVLHRDQNDKPKAVLEINNDITERKHAEREVRRLNEELEQRVADRTAQLQAANKELEAFSYSVSHDLRAPLRHIDGFSQALLEDYPDKLDDVGKNYLREVRSASQEMAQLIDDVLQLARVTRSEMRREVVNLSETVHTVAAELERTEPKRKVKVDIEEGLATRGDKRLLRILLTNLLGNAWKFTSKQKHPQIAFGEAKTNGETSYFIRDNGAGFDMAYVGKLFGAFQRLHTAGEFEGTGIGLATVQRIVYRHGGRVWAEGAVNEGATFYFTLPHSKEIRDGQQSDPTG